MDGWRPGLLAILAVVGVSACSSSEQSVPKTEAEPSQPIEELVAEPEEDLIDPVTVWRGGRAVGQIERAKAEAEGLLLVELGEGWTPYIFSESSSPQEEPKPQAYKPTYLALARGEFPDDRHGHRARRDKYLELYGIMPTLSLLRSRFNTVRGLECAKGLDLERLRSFDGFLAYRTARRAKRRLDRYHELTPQIQAIVARLGVESLEQVEEGQVEEEEWELIQEYKPLSVEIPVVAAAQARLECEGFFEGRGEWTPGLFDWRTHEALAEFERRHRIYGWGFIGKNTLTALQKTPEEVEREAVIRVLTERAMHAAKVIEDGSVPPLPSGEPRTYRKVSGEEVPIPNLEAELRDNLVEAFGLQTPESTHAWLESLGPLPESRVIAVEGIEVPEYYSDAMDLSVSIDRGDVWYEFPFDEEGKSRAQPVSRRPRLILFVDYNDQKIPLARFGTTIGGWRSEFVDRQMMWRYKDSPTGKRVWSRIAAAPVWVPPESTPPKSILSRKRGGGYKVNYHETGPSYASAYGLVAAYHRKFWNGPGGVVQTGGDEGIRTHGSVDYMSIMRRHSHGCHRMHNHLAMRLMSYVLQHRPHRRLGQKQMEYEREFEHEGENYLIEFDQGGYIYELEEPIFVHVLPGRIRGKQRTPIAHLLPKYNDEVGAYVMSDGTWVNIDRFGNQTYRPRVYEIEAGVAEIDPFDTLVNPYAVDAIAPGTPVEPYIPERDREEPDAGVAPPIDPRVGPSSAINTTVAPDPTASP